jgi:hypothetical protein
MNKKQAMIELDHPIYPVELFRKDSDFVLKKLNFTKESFNDYINAAHNSHETFGSSLKLMDELKLYYSVYKF